MEIYGYLVGRFVYCIGLMYEARCEHCVRQHDQFLKVTTLSKVLKIEMDNFWRLRGVFEILAQGDWCRPLSFSEALWERLHQAGKLQLNFNASTLNFWTLLSGTGRPSELAFAKWSPSRLDHVLCDLIQRLPKKRSCKATLNIFSDQLIGPWFTRTPVRIWESSVFHPICQSLIAYCNLSICVRIHDINPCAREDGSEWLVDLWKDHDNVGEYSDFAPQYLQKAVRGVTAFLEILQLEMETLHGPVRAKFERSLGPDIETSLNFSPRDNDASGTADERLSEVVGLRIQH